MRDEMKKLCILLVLALAFAMTSPMCVTDTYAASTATKAKKAYKKMMTSKKTITWSIRNNERKIKTSKCYYKLIYLDKDKVPELAVYNTDAFHYEGYFQIYRYSKGKIKYVTNTGDLLAYYPKKGIICDNYTGMGYSTFNYYKYSKGKLSGLKLMKETDYNVEPAKTTYSKKGNIISKNAFDNQLKPYVGTTKFKQLDGAHGWTKGK